MPLGERAVHWTKTHSVHGHRGKNGTPKPYFLNSYCVPVSDLGAEIQRPSVLALEVLSINGGQSRAPQTIHYTEMSYRRYSADWGTLLFPRQLMLARFVPYSKTKSLHYSQGLSQG